MGKLRKKYPCLFDYYMHLIRLKGIRDGKKYRKMSYADYEKKLCEVYKEAIGRDLNWDNPAAYTEKMQWAKLYDKNPLKAPLTDKYKVREWVKEKISEEYLIPLLGVWDKFTDIDFSTLPDKFALKTNNGSGTNLIVKNKATLNMKSTKRLFNDLMKTDYAFACAFEMHYSDIEPKIIAEKYMENDGGELEDYKFLCFDGQPYYCWVDKGRYSHHTRNIYNMNWELQPFHQARYGVFEKEIKKPENFDEMVRLATVLSEGFSHVRVDFYNIKGKIYFGEMTFTNGSGLDKIAPDEADFELGKLWKLNTSKKPL